MCSFDSGKPWPIAPSLAFVLMRSPTNTVSVWFFPETMLLTFMILVNLGRENDYLLVALI